MEKLKEERMKNRKAGIKVAKKATEAPLETVVLE